MDGDVELRRHLSTVPHLKLQNVHPTRAWLASWPDRVVAHLPPEVNTALSDCRPRFLIDARVVSELADRFGVDYANFGSRSPLSDDRSPNVPGSPEDTRIRELISPLRKAGAEGPQRRSFRPGLEPVPVIRR